MEYIESLNVLHLLIFTVPGFFLVWSYLRAKKKKIESDFEYFILSFFWGLVMIGFFGVLMPKEKFTHAFFENPYAGALVLSLFAVVSGSLFGGRLNKYMDRVINRVM